MRTDYIFGSSKIRHQRLTLTWIHHWMNDHYDSFPSYVFTCWTDVQDSKRCYQIESNHVSVVSFVVGMPLQQHICIKVVQIDQISFHVNSQRTHINHAACVNKNYFYKTMRTYELQFTFPPAEYIYIHTNTCISQFRLMNNFVLNITKK
jgi:hypothetical protein